MNNLIDKTNFNHNFMQNLNKTEHKNNTKLLDTFDPYMNIFFSSEKIRKDILNQMSNEKSNIFINYKSEKNRFIPENMLMNS